MSVYTIYKQGRPVPVNNVSKTRGVLRADERGWKANLVPVIAGDDLNAALLTANAAAGGALRHPIIEFPITEDYVRLHLKRSVKPWLSNESA